MIVLPSNSSVGSPETIASSWKMGIAGGKVSPLAFFHYRNALEFVKKADRIFWIIMR
jgi:hypothetical protein